jgi:hypothetical protein
MLIGSIVRTFQCTERAKTIRPLNPIKMTDKAKRTAFPNRLDFDAGTAIVEFPLLFPLTRIVGSRRPRARISLHLLSE